jgi:NAD(P)-dependent dehydrogenase (short-subunit alcohol dehydrogenase family)
MAEGGRVEARVCDIREEDEVAAFADGVMETHERIDLLVNNAGGQFLTPAEDISPKGFRTVIRLNVEGTWLMTHAVATKAMIPAGGGKVVNVTLSPHHGLPGMAHSSAARAAVENLTRVLSIEWARFGIRLTALAAGHFATETLRTKYPQAVVEGVAGTVPLGRLGTEEEFAWLVAFVASPGGDYLSGAVLTIDGARDNWFGAWPPGGLTGEGGRPLAEERRPKE